jgi:endonuclease-8
MPEGDALRRAAARLQPLVGERIEASSPNPQGEATGVARAVDGRVLERLRAVDQDRLLGEALLDQHVVAGIGNMWLAEALWASRVSPWSRLGAVTDEELAHALGWARDAMRSAVRAPAGPRAVYRRAGRPCRRCGTPIASRGLGDANRTAYWCPTCQPTPRADLVSD